MWHLQELANANASALDEVNELIVEANAILTGGGMEEARRMATRFVTQRRSLY